MAEALKKKMALKSGDREKRFLVVVDGDYAYLYYMSILLQRLEYNIYTVKTAEDALDVMGIVQPALILTEISLGGMDGVQLLKKMKRHPQAFPVPVIVLTSSNDQAVKATCLQEGCAAYLQKPVEPDVLYAAIQKATESQPRQYIRLHTSLNVIVGDDKAGQYAGRGDYITALSEHGMFISTLKPAPSGIQIPAVILLEDSKIRVEGVVLYSFQRDKSPMKTPGMGIEFVSISRKDQNAIKNYIKREITKGIPTTRVGGTLF